MTNQTRILVATLKTTFAGIKTIPGNMAKNLLDLLDKAPQEALEIIVREKIKFCWAPAARRLADNFGMDWEAIRAL